MSDYEKSRDEACEKAYRLWNDRLKNKDLKPFTAAFKEEYEQASKHWKSGYDFDYEAAIQSERAKAEKLLRGFKLASGEGMPQSFSCNERLEYLRKAIAEYEAADAK